MNRVTINDKKRAIDNFLGESDGYSLKFWSKDRGLFSGFARYKQKSWDGKTSNIYYGFVIDLINREFFVEGVSGKRLKANATTLNKLFNYGKAFSGYFDDINIKMFYNMGLAYGAYSMEDRNIGRGIMRGIAKHPTFEKIFKELYNYRGDNISASAVKNIVDRTETYGNSIREAIKPANKTIYEYIVKKASEYVLADILSLDSVNIKELNKLVESFVDSVHQVDKERGYHDADRWINENIGELISGYQSNIKWSSYLGEVLETPGVTYKNLFRYLYASCYHQQGLPTIQESLQILRDYYQMTKEYEKVPRYPRYLKTTHDVVMQNLSVLDNIDTSNKVVNYWEHNHEKFDALLGDYFLIDAVSSKEIVEEGNNNSNCVGSYVNSVSEGKTNILFLRSRMAPRNSWVTLEVSPDNVLVQAYGTFDNDLTNEQQKLLYAWCTKRNIAYAKNIGGAVTKDWENMGIKDIRVMALKNPAKYHAESESQLIKNCLSLSEEKDNNVTDVLDNVKSAV